VSGMLRGGDWRWVEWDVVGCWVESDVGGRRLKGREATTKEKSRGVGAGGGEIKRQRMSSGWQEDEGGGGGGFASRGGEREERRRGGEERNFARAFAFHILEG
jgi:hypothetical protein